jgi:hypothetical protein
VRSVPRRAAPSVRERKPLLAGELRVRCPDAVRTRARTVCRARVAPHERKPFPENDLGPRISSVSIFSSDTGSGQNRQRRHMILQRSHPEDIWQGVGPAPPAPLPGTRGTCFRVAGRGGGSRRSAGTRRKTALTRTLSRRGNNPHPNPLPKGEGTAGKSYCGPCGRSPCRLCSKKLRFRATNMSQWPGWAGSPGRLLCCKRFAALWGTDRPLGRGRRRPVGRGPVESRDFCRE